MTLLEKEPVKRAEKSIKEYNNEMSVIVLDNSAKTAIEAASSLGCEVGAIVKSLLFKTENTFTLFLVSGDKKASLNKIKKTLNIKDASMASPDDVKNVTGYTIGGVSPIGHSNKVNIFIDKSLNRFNSLFAAAGHPNCVFEISFTDLIKITNGSTDEIIEWENPIYLITYY